MIVETRDDRRRHHGNRNACFRQCFYRFKPPFRRGGARLHLAGEFPVHRGDRHTHARQPLLRHWRKDINVALDQGRFRQQADGVIVRREDFQKLAREALLPLDRLVGIGIHAQRNRADNITGTRELALQQVHSICLAEQLAFKVEPG